MADESSPPSSSNVSGNSLSNPQVVIALITGIVSILVTLIGVLPNLIGADEPTATPTPVAVVVVTATQLPPTPTAETQTVANDAPTLMSAAVSTASPTAIPMTEPTTEPTAELTIEPTTAPEQPAATQPPAPNVLLIYDNVSFSLINTSGRRLSLANVTFRSESGSFDPVGWANYRRIPNDNCLRIRDAGAGNRNPPGECHKLLSLLLIGQTAMFWTESDTFDVLQGSSVIATCTTDTDRCAIYVPQN